jgi:hypothetical protein
MRARWGLGLGCLLAVAMLLVAISESAVIRGGSSGGAAQGLDANFDLTGGNAITGATEAKPFTIRGTGAQSGNGWNIYQHSNGTPTIKCVVAEVEGACDVTVDLNAAKKFIIKQAGTTVLTIDPAATGNAKYTWASGYRPIKTIGLTADALYLQGAAALVTTSALVSGGLLAPYITVTDIDTDGFHRYVVMPPNWDGGTVTAKVTVVNVNAVPANAFEVDVSGTCYPAGTVVPTTISTTGEQPANIAFGAAGACGGSACDQNDPASATTAAITLNGTPAGGNLCGFQAQVDATATTETVAGIKVTQMDIFYAIANGF